jgi:hypothetical protein
VIHPTAVVSTPRLLAMQSAPGRGSGTHASWRILPEQEARTCHEATSRRIPISRSVRLNISRKGMSGVACLAVKPSGERGRRSIRKPVAERGAARGAAKSRTAARPAKAAAKVAEPQPLDPVRRAPARVVAGAEVVAAAAPGPRAAAHARVAVVHIPPAGAVPAADVRVEVAGEGPALRGVGPPLVLRKSSEEGLS